MEQENFQTLLTQLIVDIKDDIRSLRAEMHDRFDRTDKRMDGMEEEMKKDRSKLEEVYQARNAVKIKFGWGWSMAALLIAVIASGITQVFWA